MSNSSTTAARIFLVDDHAMVRQGLVTVLLQAGFEICGQAASLQETLDHPQLGSAQLAVVDLSLGDDSGIELIKRLQARRIPSLVYSMHEDSNVVRSAFAAGAIGYVTKREVALSLVEAVKSVLMGRMFISPRAGVGLVPQSPEPPPIPIFQEFSDQQLRLYELLGQGFGIEEIATRLEISPRTVESYAARMIAKLNVSGMKELRRRAIADNRLPHA